ncbi:MAG TPA: hypothetical protein PLX85_00520 [Dehalococcoidia bacterium]|nr:hypothetical protein [Dehalococcoidia bacterium]
MSGQAWTYLNPRSLAPQPERLTEVRRTSRREKPKTRDERALDLFFKGKTATGRSSGEGGGGSLTAEDVRHALGGLAPKPFRFGMSAFLGDAQSLRLLEGFLIEELRWKAEAGEWLRKREDVERIERMASLMLFEVISARSRHDTFAHQERLPEGSAAVLCPKCNGRGAFGDSRAVEKWRRYRRMVRRARLRNPFPKPEDQDPRSAWTKRRTLHDALIAKSRVEEARAAAQLCEVCSGTGRFIFTETHRARAVAVSRRTWYRDWAGRYTELIEIPRRWEAIAVAHVRRKLADRT